MKKVLSIISLFILSIILVFVARLLIKKYTQSNENIQESLSYEEKLFDKSFVHKVKIEINSGDLEELNKNPIDKTKYHSNITIDGVKIEDVSFSAKGNTSLIKPFQENKTRFSYKINFGKYKKGQTYFGLDKLHLNNCAWDSSFMRDYFSYEILKKTGSIVPLVSYTELYINDEYRGLYVAIEDIDRSFLIRNQKNSKSNLYKPETSMMANVGKQDKRIHSNDSLGVDLVYSGDKFENYTSIFDHTVHKVSDNYKKFLIKAIKALNDGINVEKYWDIDAIISYMAGNNFVFCIDSYMSSVPHNYYLLEDNQKVSILPWDYDLSFGSSLRLRPEYISNPSVDPYEYPIDEPLYYTSIETHPLWKIVATTPEYLEKYHEKIQYLIDTYIDSFEFEEEFTRVYEMIDEYVKNDPTKLEPYSQFESEANELKFFCLSRSSNIKKQLKK